MAKKYLVMKDPEAGASGDNWIIMNPFEFVRFIETEEGQRRKGNFERLDAASEDDDTLIMECVPEKAKEIKEERNHADYLRRMEEASGYETLSLDVVVEISDEGDTRSYMDMAVDETMDTEEMAMAGLKSQELAPALSELDEAERELILALYTGDEKMNESRYAEMCGETRWAIRERHKTALRKLRLHFRRKRLL